MDLRTQPSIQVEFRSWGSKVLLPSSRARSQKVYSGMTYIERLRRTVLPLLDPSMLLKKSVPNGTQKANHTVSVPFTWTFKVCKTIAFWAVFGGFGQLLYIVLGSRE